MAVLNVYETIAWCQMVHYWFYCVLLVNVCCFVLFFIVRHLNVDYSVMLDAAFPGPCLVRPVSPIKDDPLRCFIGATLCTRLFKGTLSNVFQELNRVV